MLGINLQLFGGRGGSGSRGGNVSTASAGGGGNYDMFNGKNADNFRSFNIVETGSAVEGGRKETTFYGTEWQVRKMGIDNARNAGLSDRDIVRGNRSDRYSFVAGWTQGDTNTPMKAKDVFEGNRRAIRSFNAEKKSFQKQYEELMRNAASK